MTITETEHSDLQEGRGGPGDPHDAGAGPGDPRGHVGSREGLGEIPDCPTVPAGSWRTALEDRPKGNPRVSPVARGLWRSAKRRAGDLGLPFGIVAAEIIVPEYCPILGLRLRPGDGHIQDHSPTLDRIRPPLGYVSGNILVISARANRLKSDASMEELLRIASFYQQLRGND